MPEGIAGWFNASGDPATPAYSAEDHRRLDAVMMIQGVPDRFGARGGIHPGGGDAVALTGQTITVAHLKGVVYPGWSSTDGPYRVVVLAGEHTLTPAAGSPRKDIVVLRLEDNDVDSSGAKRAVTELRDGEPALTPTEPVLRQNEIRLATIDVPAGGNPPPTLTYNAPYVVANGGVLPVRTRAALPSAGIYSGMSAYVQDEQSLVVAHAGVWDAVGNRKGFGYWQTVKYEANGTFTRGNYPGLRAVMVHCQGGGGGGGGTATTAFGESSSSGGGGGGVYARKWVPASALSASTTITVGAGGASAAAVDGTAGGTSSFGSHCVAPGGTGGFTRATSAGFRASSGATATTGGTGDLIIPGGAGSGGFSFGQSIVTPGTADKGLYGAGGSSVLGGTGRAARGPSTAAQNGSLYGVGGSGTISGFTDTPANAGEPGKPGGTGAAGVVLVDLFV